MCHRPSEVFESLEDPQWASDAAATHPLCVDSARYEPMRKITHPGEKIQRVNPLLKAMTKYVFVTGETGAGKSMRDGEGFQTTGTYASGALDMVVHNCTIIDAVLGIVKGDIGIRDGRTAALRRAAAHRLRHRVLPLCRHPVQGRRSHRSGQGENAPRAGGPQSGRTR
eukprot:gene45117-61112_t